MGLLRRLGKLLSIGFAESELTSWILLSISEVLVAQSIIVFVLCIRYCVHMLMTSTKASKDTKTRRDRITNEKLYDIVYTYFQWCMIIIISTLIDFSIANIGMSKRAYNKVQQYRKHSRWKYPTRIIVGTVCFLTTKDIKVTRGNSAKKCNPKTF
jgi:hypothetical protein